MICKTLTYYTADCVIEALANPDKEKLKHEDTNLSQWLQGMGLPLSMIHIFVWYTVL